MKSIFFSDKREKPWHFSRKSVNISYCKDIWVTGTVIRNKALPSRVFNLLIAL